MTKPEYVFGRYRLRPGRDLISSGVPVPIGMKALDVLAALVEAEGELVTKDELMDRVWPGLVVEEHNIQVHISALRKVMGSDARWILTVPRLGYRFVGPVALGGPVGPALGRPLNRLFGREDDLAAIRAILDAARLVTLVGPGGIGKTRLGLETAHAIGDRYRDGAIFVDLSVLQDPSLVPSQVAAALGIELNGDAPQAELLARRLKSRELLILLDNCEHVVTAVAVLAELILAEAPLVSLVATSREPLACAGEQVYRLPLLPVPTEGLSSAVEALAAPSVALLVNRVQAADQRFELADALAAAAGAICRRLDGLPLAIEMVGPHIAGLGLEAVAVCLEEAVRLPCSITRTATPRHRSLEATLDWSHALLSLTERVMLRRLAVFPGWFSLGAVGAVVSDELMSEALCGAVLAGLVRKSLVSIDLAAGPFAYRMLETVRSYAAAKLEAAGEQPALHARHARYVGDILARAIQDWEVTADDIWLDRYQWLLADLRAALRWSFGSGGDPAFGQVIVGRSAPLWRMLHLNGEGRCWAETAVAALEPDIPESIAAPVWFAVGYLTGSRSFERSTQALRKATELFGQSNDQVERGSALAVLGQMLALSGRRAAAADALAEARNLLEPGTGKRSLGVCVMASGMLHVATGSWSEARQDYEMARALFEALGAKRLATAALCNLADMMWAEGTLPVAIETARAALDQARREGHRRYVGVASGCLTGMLTVCGDLDEALIAAREAVPHCREDEYIYWLLPHLALRAAKAKRGEDAARIWGYADRITGSGADWQINEQRAADALVVLLRDTMDPVRMQQLMAAGRYLSEDEVIALALA